PQKLNFSRLKLLRDVMEKNGDTQRAIWFNEFAWNASPADFPKDKLTWRRVSDEEQAKYTVDAIKLAQSWGWAGALNIWYFRQVGDITPDRSDYFFRMVDTDFTPRPVYHAVKDLSNALRTASAGTVQELNPAVSTMGRWSIRLAQEAQGGAMIQAASADARLSFTFEGTDATLIAATGPKGGRFLVTVDDKDPGLEKKDNQGRSIVDLAAQQAEFGKKFIVAKGQRGGAHTVKLEPVSVDQDLLVDAFEVENKPATGPAAVASEGGGLSLLFIGLAVLGVVGLGAGFMLRGNRR
ncbi:MAG: hypothetical protein NTZ05_04580, partial [Chloroflexi bacterium]|nr:hypothetical protein [Chloroflexota bacterium]